MEKFLNVKILLETHFYLRWIGLFVFPVSLCVLLLFTVKVSSVQHLFYSFLFIVIAVSAEKTCSHKKANERLYYGSITYFELLSLMPNITWWYNTEILFNNHLLITWLILPQFYWKQRTLRAIDNEVLKF